MREIPRARAVPAGPLPSLMRASSSGTPCVRKRLDHRFFRHTQGRHLSHFPQCCDRNHAPGVNMHIKYKRRRTPAACLSIALSVEVPTDARRWPLLGTLSFFKHKLFVRADTRRMFSPIARMWGAQDCTLARRLGSADEMCTLMAVPLARGWHL